MELSEQKEKQQQEDIYIALHKRKRNGKSIALHSSHMYLARVAYFLFLDEGYPFGFC